MFCNSTISVYTTYFTLPIFDLINHLIFSSIYEIKCALNRFRNCVEYKFVMNVRGFHILNLNYFELSYTFSHSSAIDLYVRYINCDVLCK